MVPRFQGIAGVFIVVVVGGGVVDVAGYCILREASCQMSQLLTRPAEWPPSFDYHHHLLVFVSNDERDGLKTLSIQAYVENVVCRPVSHPYECDFFHAAILTEVVSKDIPIVVPGRCMTFVAFLAISVVAGSIWLKRYSRQI